MIRENLEADSPGVVIVDRSNSRGNGSVVMGKRDKILATLRASITDGQLQPGEQLPTRAVLQETFDAGPVTIQRAFDLLLEEGFVTAKRGVGTQVVDNPPHRHRYALVFPEPLHRDQTLGNRFWGALKIAGEAINRKNPGRFKLYYGVDGHRDNPDYQALCDDVAHRRIAGVFFASSPHHLEDHALVKQRRVPMVAIDSGPGVGAVRPLRLSKDTEFQRFAEHLQQVGCRRVAMVGYQTRRRDLDPKMTRYLAAVGIELPERWCVRCGHSLLESAQDVTRLLFSAPADQRPDGLIVADDNFTEHAIAGVLESGCRVPEDVKVVSLWNFPQTPPRIVPFHMVGPDTTIILDAAVAVCQKTAKNPTDRTPVTIDACRQDQKTAVTVS